MKYSDTTNLNGVIQTIEDLTDLGQTTISGDASLLKRFTSYVNQKNREIWASIFNVTGNWQYDDGNQTDMPSATSNLVDSQNSYALPSDALTVHKVEIKDSNGDWYTLTPITKEMTDNPLDELFETDGTPEYYRLVGNTIYLYPATNYASTGGLKVYFDRDVYDFTTSDTTKTPGFASPFHHLLPLKVAIYWLEMKQPTSPSLDRYRLEEVKLEANLKNFYSKRFKDYKPIISRVKENWK